MTTSNEIWEQVKRMQREIDQHLLDEGRDFPDSIFVAWNCGGCGVGSILLVLKTCPKERVASEIESIHRQFSKECKVMGGQ